MNKLEKWYENWGNKIAKVILSVLGIYLFMKYLLSYVAPFVLAWIIAMMLQKIVTLLNERIKLGRGIATALSMVTVLSGISWALMAIVRKIFIEVNILYQQIPMFKNEFLEIFNNIGEKVQEIFSSLPFNVSASLENSVENLFQKLASFLGGFLSKGSINVVTKLPDILFFTMMTLLAIFFMTRDYDKIKRFVVAQLPESTFEKTKVLKEDLLGALWGYVKTQLILMGITGVVCIVGFLILRVDSWFVISISIGVLDALPVFGSGAILIPWALYNLIMGDYIVSVGLISIYLLIVVIRQTVEPKILSNQIGVYTLVTLIGMYIGFKGLGVIGLIVGPVLIVIIKTLQKADILPQFKKVEE